MDDVMDDEVRDVDAWQGAVAGALLPFHVECSAPERFHGSISRRLLGETSLIAMTSQPHCAVRSPEHIDDRPAEYLLSLQLAGSAQFRQDGRGGLREGRRLVVVVRPLGREVVRHLGGRVAEPGVGIGGVVASSEGRLHGLTLTREWT